MRWGFLALPLVLQAEGGRLEIYLDQRTPPQSVRRIVAHARAAGTPFDVYVVVRDFDRLELDLLRWRLDDPSVLRLADPAALKRLGRFARRLPAFLYFKGGVCHRAHGLPDLRRLVRCSRR